MTRCEGKASTGDGGPHKAQPDAEVIAAVDQALAAGQLESAKWGKVSDVIDDLRPVYAEERIDAAMQGDKTMQVNLKEKLTVVVFLRHGSRQLRAGGVFRR